MDAFSENVTFNFGSKPSYVPREQNHGLKRFDVRCEVRLTDWIPSPSPDEIRSPLSSHGDLTEDH